MARNFRMKRKASRVKDVSRGGAPAPKKSGAKLQVVIPRAITVKQLADTLGVSGIEIIRCLIYI